MQESMVLIHRRQDTKCNYYFYLTQPISNKSLYRKAEAPHPGARTPFDCCGLSFQPFSHPVCARNSDGTGIVFDLVNIIPWLK